MIALFKSVPGKSVVPAFFAFLLAVPFSGTHAQISPQPNRQLASSSVRPMLLITREPNVLFPELLGNCGEAIPYMEDFVQRRRDYLIRMYTRGKKWLPKAASVLSKYKLPSELRVLLTLESAYQGGVVSRAGAVGFWQIMDEVAREYGMKYVPHFSEEERKKLMKENPRAADSLFKALIQQKDDRKNFLKATTVAARYLRDRRVNLNDNWLLVVASYNCGVGNVWKALQKSGKPNGSFWDIRAYLPEETQAYVMNFITLNVVFSNFEKFLSNQLRFRSEEIWVPDNFEQHFSDEQESSGGGSLR
jgi:membrane-bound lytic murein transglycosylase D